jgi:hypothetical protein
MKEFKNELRVHNHIDQQVNSYTLTPYLEMIIYELRDGQWQQVKTLQMYKPLTLEDLNQKYIDELSELVNPPQEPIISDDPDDIPF